ncbi:MAG: hypothetical protein NT062_17910 [Proteobacteria bacterium]|nr:hypothetical protein [Pseudomonadota bacterium]
MASWENLLAYVQQDYGATQNEDGLVALVYSWEAEDRSQALIISTYENNDVQWLSLQSGVCDESELDHQEALERNADIAVGGLILEEGQYWLHYGVPLALVNDTDVLDELLLYVATMADALESEISGGDDN